MKCNKCGKKIKLSLEIIRVQEFDLGKVRKGPLWHEKSSKAGKSCERCGCDVEEHHFIWCRPRRKWRPGLKRRVRRIMANLRDIFDLLSGGGSE